MHLHSMLLNQVDGTSSNEDAQTFHSTGEYILATRKKEQKEYTHEV